MKHLIINPLVIASVIAFSDIALSAEFNTYDVNRSQTCINNCIGDITLTGTITVDTLGSLEVENVIDWNLVFNSTNYSNTIITPANSRFFFTNGVSLKAQKNRLDLITNGLLFDFSDTIASPFGVAWTIFGVSSTFVNAPRLLSNGEPVDVAEGIVPQDVPITIGTRTIQSTPESGTILGLLTMIFYLIASKNKKQD